MNMSEAIRLTDDVVGIAEQLKEDLAHEHPRKEVFQELFSLRRSVEQLERKVRDTELDAVGDAC